MSAKQHILDRLYQACETEKAYAAHKIHNELGQQIVALRLGLAGARNEIKAYNKHSYKKVGHLLSLTDEMIRNIRQIAAALYPSTLEDLGLASALQWQTEEFARMSGIRASFKMKKVEINVPDFTGIMIFRVYEEILANIARHANASEVTIILETKNNHLHLTTTDNGKGFDVKQADQRETFGLEDIKGRLQVIGGTCEISSEPGVGTSVSILVPLTESE